MPVLLVGPVLREAYQTHHYRTDLTAPVGQPEPAPGRGFRACTPAAFQGFRTLTGHVVVPSSAGEEEVQLPVARTVLLPVQAEQVAVRTARSSCLPLEGLVLPEAGRTCHQQREVLHTPWVERS